MGVEGFLAIIESFQYLEELDMEKCEISSKGMKRFGEVLVKHDKVSCVRAVSEGADAISLGVKC